MILYQTELREETMNYIKREKAGELSAGTECSRHLAFQQMRRYNIKQLV